MKGEAKVKRSGRSGTKIELSVDNMPRPFELGAGYATYVLWAISPTGQADNLGEIKRSGLFFIDSKITVTTPLQTFAMIITAEPHYLVTRPSQAIMFENLYPSSSSGVRIGTTPAFAYFGNSSDYFRDPRTPSIAEIDYAKTPPAILQAQQAIALAKFAGAERDASAELGEAETLLQNASNAFQAGRDSDTVDITARKAIAAGVVAENLAEERKVARERRNEKSRSDSEIRAAESKFTDAQSQIEDLKAELARETRNRELAEREAITYSNQVKDLRQENGQLREDLGKIRAERDTANAKLSAIETQRQAETAESDRLAKEEAAKAAESELIASLRSFGSVTKDGRGIVLTLPENFWTNTRSASLASRGDSKLISLGQLLAGNQDYRITVQAYTDDKGDAASIKALTDKRSYAVADHFASAGVAEGRIVAKGLGSSDPLAPNTTNANRAKNRRVEVLLTFFPQ